MKINFKNPTWITGGMSILLFCALFTSCSNEELLGEQGSVEECDKICFGLASDAGAGTRALAEAGDEAYTASRFVLRSDNSADTLCMRAVVTDGIYTSQAQQTAVTRGLPVTGQNDFYSQFHVVAYWKRGSTAVGNFFMDEDAAKKSTDSNIWSTDRIYYWPGLDHKLQFVAWAPTAISGFTAPTTASKTLAYTVPATVADQKDILVAQTEEIEGTNKTTAVPLSFEHICTQVRFVIGSEMQPGTIKSIKLKGIKNAGTYDIASKSWTLTDATAEFSQTMNQATTGSETEGTAITSGENIFMMLPQTLGETAQVEVVFTNENGEDRTLTASIVGTSWPIGKTVTYKLSISPEYELEFVSQPVAQDAHYVIYPITIKADKLPEGGWTLTSNDTDNVTFVERFANDGLKSLVDQGYWLKDYCGRSTLNSSTIGEVQVYVFLKENVTDTDRDITLSLKPAQGNYKAQEFAFKQYCPAWNNGIGVERIQDKDYPWGFNWDSNMKITYSMPSTLNSAIIHILWGIFGDHSYVSESGYVITGNWKVTVDFSKVPKLTKATSSDDGLTNTWDIYTFDGINEASTIMAQLESWGGVPDKELPSNPQEFAAWSCAKKNRFGVTSRNQGSQVIYNPQLDQADMAWYLPAQNEAPNMNDNLSGDYWTSTAITDPGTTAYKYTAGGSTSAENRNSVIHVRAVRKKTN